MPENELLKDITLTVDIDKLPPDQQQEILSYIEFVKNKEKQKISTPPK